MKDHVPDLDKCKLLKKKGFPQDLQFFIVAHEGVQWGNDTLPNALADLWLWLKERTE